MKLLDNGLPVCTVRLILVDWYSKIYYAAVNWEGCISSLSRIRSGVRQEGVLSLALFNIYIRQLIDSIIV